MPEHDNGKETCTWDALSVLFSSSGNSLRYLYLQVCTSNREVGPLCLKHAVTGLICSPPLPTPLKKSQALISEILQWMAATMSWVWFLTYLSHLRLTVWTSLPEKLGGFLFLSVNLTEQWILRDSFPFVKESNSNEDLRLYYFIYNVEMSDICRYQ